MSHAPLARPPRPTAVARLVRAVASAVRRLRSAHRREWKLAARAAACLAAALVWGVGIEPRLVDERVERVEVPGLPAEWSGARLALIADLQVGMWLANSDTIARIVDRLVEERPAAVLIAGDFLYHPTDEAGEPREAREELEAEDVRILREQAGQVASLLQPLLDEGIPVVAVLGNHDYAMRVPASLALPDVADRLAASLRSAGVTLLRNQAVPLGDRDAGGPTAARLFVAGLDAWFPHRTDVEAALAEIPAQAPRLFLLHNPQSFRRLPAGTAPAALGAHTHGGQIRVPFLPRWSWMSLVKESPVEADGWAARDFGTAGNRLYVNRGIGFSVLPVRINCRPELTWITLSPAA